MKAVVISFILCLVLITSANAIDNGLIHHYKFNNETASNTAIDSGKISVNFSLATSSAGAGFRSSINPTMTYSWFGGTSSVNNDNNMGFTLGSVNGTDKSFSTCLWLNKTGNIAFADRIFQSFAGGTQATAIGELQFFVNNATHLGVSIHDSADIYYYYPVGVGWTFYCFIFNGTFSSNKGQLSFYANNILIGQTNFTNTWIPVNSNFYFSDDGSGSAVSLRNVMIDDWRFYNRTLTFNETSSLYNNGSGIEEQYIPPIMSNINCTSCNIPNGDVTPPYTTSDTTPTFRVDTDITANCRIGNQDINYSAMGATRQCTSGEGNLNHVCTLTTQDELLYSTSYVYIKCINPYFPDNETSSGALQMEITSLGDTSSNAIDQGIQASAIWPGAVVYDNQQVYLRNLNNDQVLATVDRVAVYGNQRWLFNYALENESSAGLFNITPAVYVLEMSNLSSSAIKTAVETYINSTKT